MKLERKVRLCSAAAAVLIAAIALTGCGGCQATPFLMFTNHLLPCLLPPLLPPTTAAARV